MSNEHEIATESVLKASSKEFCAGLKSINGCTSEDRDVISKYEQIGSQALQLAKAIDIVRRMIRERTSEFHPDLTIEDEFIRPKTACTIFLAAPNIASDGIRENIKLLVEHKMVDCIVTDAGGIEMDLIESPRKTIAQILDEMLEEKSSWTSSELIERVGKNNPGSICFWAATNKIPIFCPSLSPKSFKGLLSKYKLKGLVLDPIKDIRRINIFSHNTAKFKTGVIVLGGGVPKHHTMNANLMRNGANYAVYINNAPEFDCSDSGANPDEAISWGKIHPEALVVKVTSQEREAFSSLVDQTFLRHLKLEKPIAPEGLDFQKAKSILDEMLGVRAASHLNLSAIFLAYTSNMASTGLRETIRSLVEHKMIDCVVATAGGIEEDLIKSLELRQGQYAETFVGDFSKWSGPILRENAINRIGNLFVPNDNYCRFEDWLIPILNQMLEERDTWLQSEFIERLGLEINHPNSICYWAARNKIPIFCPALTDGSLGDMLYFHSFRSPGLRLDPCGDFIRIENVVRETDKGAVGVIVLGGGAAEKYLMEAIETRGGADYGVFINTAAEFDRLSHGKLKRYLSEAKLKASTKWAELTDCATLVFAKLVAQTFFNHIK